MLYISNGGRVVCKEHGGGYLRSYLNNKPDAKRIETPLDTWLRIPSSVDTTNVTCEECE
jgi:hypothetical protein